MRQIICISGKGEAGKDTSALMLKARLEAVGDKVLVLHYADLLKFYCKNYFGWNGDKDFIGRTLLQRIGTDIVRSKDPDYWVKEVSNFIVMFKDEFDYFIIPDCRFPNEFEYLSNQGFKVISVRIERPQHENKLTEEQRKHRSEVSLDHYFHDYIIMNNGSLEELEEKVYKFIKLFNL